MKNYYERRKENSIEQLLAMPAACLDQIIHEQAIHVEEAQKDLKWLKDARIQHQATCDMLAREDEFNSAHAPRNPNVD